MFVADLNETGRRASNPLILDRRFKPTLIL